MDRPKSIKDILSGLIFLVFGAAFGYAASGYEFGSALRMGPGFFPVVLAAALGVLGAAIFVKGLMAAAEDGPIGVIPSRALVFVLGAVVFFGLTVRGLGLAPAVFLTAFAAALASVENSPPRALVIAAALTAFCVLIFSVGLGISAPVIGPWLSALFGR